MTMVSSYSSWLVKSDYSPYELNTVPSRTVKYYYGLCAGKIGTQAQTRNYIPRKKAISRAQVGQSWRLTQPPWLEAEGFREEAGKAM